MTPEGQSSLAEYMSRETRYRLVQLCLEEIKGRLPAEEKSTDEGVEALAARLGVCHRTVERWMRGRTHTCMGEVDALIAYSIKAQPHKAAKILKRGLDNHRRVLVFTLVKAILEGDLKPEAET